MITYKIVLDKRRETKKGYPVKLRVTYEREPRVYPVGIYLTEKEFIRIVENKRLNKYEQKVRAKLTEFENKAEKIKTELSDDFSFEEFKIKLIPKPQKKVDVFSVFETVIKGTITYGTSVSYRNAYNKFQSYINPSFDPKEPKIKSLEFKKVTPEWLYQFEEYETTTNELSKNTIGIYTRALRVVFNRAIENRLIPETCYPFGKGKYIIPSDPKKKIPLSKEEVKTIANYKAGKNTVERYYRDLWLFSYLANGINIQDIIQLKWSNLTDDTIYFIRDKTKNSNRASNDFVEVYRLEQINRIIEEHGNPSASYIFPVLNGTETPADLKRTKNQLIKQINKYIRKIAKECKINKDVTTYVARHTFSNVTLNNGGSIEYIQEALGHKNPQTTLNYLKGFELKEKKKQAENLL